ncbi:hypothetical protein SO802_029752 [Lithocarpus litseifolius]|uniref:Uncharacterized protein n=1 Tax=Lithocarpus litseifolius TaxID=425828 RepID=A0AAW2BV23_9ROSI
MPQKCMYGVKRVENIKDSIGRERVIYTFQGNNQVQQVSLHYPNVIFNPPEAIDHLHNCVSMLDVVTSMKIPQGNQTFGVPNQRVLEESENLVDSIEEIRFKFLFIAKPVSVDGDVGRRQCQVT